MTPRFSVERDDAGELRLVARVAVRAGVEVVRLPIDRDALDELLALLPAARARLEQLASTA